LPTSADKGSQKEEEKESLAKTGKKIGVTFGFSSTEKREFEGAKMPS